jgi:glucosyl-dolichyl phosphate glucuronosyltransferase
VIHHRVPVARQRFAYYRTRCYAEGLSKALVTDSVGVQDGLSSERAYAAVALRRGVTKGLRQGLSGELSGLLRAGAITAGLAYTTAGYVVGRRRGTQPRKAAP